MPKPKRFPEMLKRIQRCHYCRREMAIPALHYAENPFCNRCLAERTKAKSIPGARNRWVRHGSYMRLT